MFVYFGNDGDGVVDLVGNTSEILLGKEFQLVGGGEMKNFARNSVGEIIGNRMAARTQDLVANGHVERLGRLTNSDSNHFAFFDTLTGVESEVDQNLGVFMQNRLRGDKIHGWSISRDWFKIGQ